MGEKGPIKIAVVGHANTGKTSLMRTLLRDSGFGTVSNHPGTTRHVEGGTLLANGLEVITLFDTPGLEDSIGLLEDLEQLEQGLESDGLDRLRLMLEHAEQFPQYQQEIKVVRQLLQSDLLFYVIDCREPVLGKYRDELSILNYAARPVIPVLNFVAAPGAQAGPWREQLARMGLHATVEFDTVVFSFEGEKRLYQQIQSLLGQHYDAIQALIEDRQQQVQLALRAAARCSANLWLNVAAYRLEADVDAASLAAQTQLMQDRVRSAEASCNAEVLQLFGFNPQDVEAQQLAVAGGRWHSDLFDPDNLAQFGIKAGSAAVKGAAAGAGVDLLTGGLSLGLATALGATAGLLWSGGRRFGRDVAVRMRGHQQVCVDEPTLKVLWFRQRELLQASLDRGHAAQQPLQLGDAEASLPGSWSRWLGRCRSNGSWSALNSNYNPSNPEREKLASEIGEALQLQIHGN